MRNNIEAFYFCYIERSVLTHTLLKEGLSKAAQEEFGGFVVEEVGMELAKGIDPNAYIYRVTRRQQ